MDFEARMLGGRYTFSTLALGRIMALWLQKESGAQRTVLAKCFGCAVY